MSKRLVLIYPSKCENNTYLERIVDCLQLAQYKVVQFNKFYKEKSSEIRSGILYLNWIESSFVASNGKWKISGFMRIVLVILFKIIYRPKIVWVMHNYNSHYGGRKTKWLFRNLSRYFRKISDEVIVHDKFVANKNSANYIPFPLYKGFSKGKTQNHYARFCVFGVIAEYKGIDKLLMILPLKTNLEIIGPCADVFYLEKLERIVRSRKLSNVRISPGFISESELKKKVRYIDCFIVCHLSLTAIVSSSSYFAISTGSYLIERKVEQNIDVIPGALYYEGERELKRVIDYVDYQVSRNIPAKNIGYLGNEDWNISKELSRVLG